MRRPCSRTLVRNTAVLAVAIGLNKQTFAATGTPAPPPGLGAAAGAGSPPSAQADRPRINPTRRTLRFIVPLTDGPTYLGDVELAVSPQDELSVVAPRLMQLLEPIITDEVYARLVDAVGASPEISGIALSREGIVLVYDSQRLALYIVIPVASRRTTSFSLRRGGGAQKETLQPAHVSAFLNLRSSADIVYQGPDAGIQAPFASLDGAARIGNVVVEGEGYASARKGDAPFRRAGTRMVVDDFRHDVRWMAGDLQPITRSFQSSASLGGFSVGRLYSQLHPQREIRATGAQSFTIQAPSTVETIVNGRSVERRRLQPGTYSIADFPLAEGGNDVRLVIEDDTGARRTIDFSIFSDRSLLEPGLSEFQLNGGFVSRPTRMGLDYSPRFVGSAFWRRGLSPQLTAGINAQADADTQMGGIELLLGTPIGLVGVDAAGSLRSDGRRGWAISATYQLLHQRNDSFRSQSLRAGIEYRSSAFTPVSDFRLAPPSKSVQASLSYNNSFGLDNFVGAELRYGRSGAPQRTDYSIKGLFGLRLTDRTRLVGEAEYRRFDRREEGVARIGLLHRFGGRGQARADISSRGQVQASVQDSGGQSVGAWSVSADLDRTVAGTTANLSGALMTNRAELGVSHIAAYQGATNRIDQRSSLRLGTSIAFADGSLAVGRPITNSFLIGTLHSTLKGNKLRVEPQGEGETASSGKMGPALVPDLSPYSDRIVAFDVPGAPSGYDLGAGNVGIHPPYRSGYKMVVGSDYHLLVLGRLIDKRGEPVSLLAGKATDLGNPTREPITIFTGRNGKFGAQGLRPGKWRIEMPTQPPTIFEILVGKGTNDVVQMGDVHAQGGDKGD